MPSHGLNGNQFNKVGQQPLNVQRGDMSGTGLMNQANSANLTSEFGETPRVAEMSQFKKQ